MATEQKCKVLLRTPKCKVLLRTLRAIPYERRIRVGKTLLAFCDPSTLPVLDDVIFAIRFFSPLHTLAQINALHESFLRTHDFATLFRGLHALRVDVTKLLFLFDDFVTDVFRVLKEGDFWRALLKVDPAVVRGMRIALKRHQACALNGAAD